MKLSIIIPVYNGEKTIEKCLKSILLSKDKMLEVIIVNDGSKDNTKNVIEKVATTDLRIKIYNNDNHGVSYSRNYGIEKAHGKYIMFVDADDYLSEEWPQIVEQDLNDEYDVVYYYGRNDINLESKNDLIAEIMSLNKGAIAFSGPVSKIYKKSIIGDVRFNEALINGEDTLFNLEVALKMNKYKVVNRSFYNYVIYSGSATKSFNEKIFDTDKRFHVELKKILEASSLDKDMIQKIITCCLEKAFITINSRIAFLPDYKMAKKEFAKLESFPYRDFLKNQKIKVKSKKDMLLMLNKFKLYYFIYIAFKIQNRKNMGNQAEQRVILV